MMENNAPKTIAMLPLDCAFMFKVQPAVLPAKPLLIALNGVFPTNFPKIANNHSVIKLKELVLLLMLLMWQNAQFQTATKFAQALNAHPILVHTIAPRR
jgi:hypothetical protein